jgi:heat-inducible transcriptional repressor
MDPPRPEELDEREKEILRAIVHEYISTGGPVGSTQLTRKAEFEVSSATVRNVMADLEELGLLEKPHTSAGRVPTDRGFRFYVDTLVKLREPAARDREIIQHGISVESAVEQTLQEASKVLHALTRHAGVVLTPRPSTTVFHSIELVLLRENRVLAVLVGHNGQVQNKVFTVDFPVTSEDLVRAANYLNDLLKHVPIEEVRGRILSEMEQEKALYDALASKALKLGRAATDLDVSERVLIEGAGSFLETPEFSDVERMRALFKALEEKGKLLDLLDRVQRAREMQIFIGKESAFSSSSDLTVIASPYGSPEQVLGTVGVIGPTRMDYQRVIPLVNFTAQVLSKVLSQE